MRVSSPRSGPQSGPLPAVPQVSIGSWAFAFGPYENDPWPFERVCDFAAKVGYDGVEINGFRPHPHYDDFIGGKGTKELKVQISEHDLGISAYAPDLHHVPPARVSTEAYVAEIDKAREFRVPGDQSTSCRHGHASARNGPGGVRALLPSAACIMVGSVGAVPQIGRDPHLGVRTRLLAEPSERGRAPGEGDRPCELRHIVRFVPRLYRRRVRGETGNFPGADGKRGRLRYSPIALYPAFAPGRRRRLSARRTYQRTYASRTGAGGFRRSAGSSQPDRRPAQLVVRGSLLLRCCGREGC